MKLTSIKLTARQLWTLGVVGLVAVLVAAFSYRQLQLASSPEYNTSENAASEYYGTPLDKPLAVAPFELTDAAGARVTLQKWRGDVVLVFFGFTRCPDVCPLTLGRLAKAYQDVGEPEDVKVVMITVDPQHDTPQRTQAYARSFSRSFVGLGGSSSDVANAARTFFVGYRGLENQDFLHTDSVALLDRQGRMRLIYGQDKIARLSEDLPKILAARDF